MYQWVDEHPFDEQARRLLRDAYGGVEQIEIIRVWPEPDAALSSASTEGWLRWTPTLHHHWLDHPLPDDEESRHVGDFWDWDVDTMDLLRIIPEQVRRTIAPVSYHDYWPSLRLIHAIPDLADVFASAPVLGAALARYVGAVSNEGAALGRIRKRLRGRRTRLLGVLGLPEERWALRMFGKLGAHSLDHPGIDGIRRLLTTDDPRIRKLLQHLPTLREDVLVMLLRPGSLDMARHSLLADEDDCIAGALDLYLREIAIGRLDGTAPWTPARFSSRAEVLAAYEAAPLQPCQEPWDPADYPAEFATPAGDVVLEADPEVHLRPITSSAAMFSWGVEEGLCVPTRRDYPEAAAAGEAGMFGVTFTELGLERRGTLWLRVADGGRWEIAEFMLTANADVPPWLRSLVGAWCRELGENRPAGRRLLGQGQ